MLNINIRQKNQLVQAGGAVLVEKVMYWIRVLQEATNAYLKNISKRDALEKYQEHDDGSSYMNDFEIEEAKI